MSVNEDICIWRTSPPPANLSASACDSILKNYCSGLDSAGYPKVITDPRCREWIFAGMGIDKTLTQIPGMNQPRLSPLATSLLVPICNTRKGLELYPDVCMDFCRTSGGACDSGSTDYCNIHPDDPYCSCLVVPADVKKVSAKENPSCFWAPCRDNGYQPSGQLSQLCPDIMDCSSYIELGPNSAQNVLNNVSLQTICSMNNSTKDTTQTSNTPPISTTTNITQTIQALTPLNIFLIILFIAVIFAALIITIIIYKKRKNKKI